jgi:hypothetical protein
VSDAVRVLSKASGRPTTEGLIRDGLAAGVLAAGVTIFNTTT